MAVDRIGDGLALRSKGDIVSHDGTANISVSAGTDGQILIAQSSASSGLQWKTFAAAATQYYEHIATSTATTGVSEFIFSNIASTYTDLVLYVSYQGRTSDVSGYYTFVQVNGLSTSIYNRQYLAITGSPYTYLHGQQLDQTSAWVSTSGGRNEASAQNTNGTEVIFYNYANTSQWKNIGSIDSSVVTDSITDRGFMQNLNVVELTSAITSIRLFTTTVFQTGSKAMLYGIKRYGQ